MSDGRKVLVFRLGRQEFGADIRDVREVIVAPEVTTLPKAEPPVVGVFNLRGHIVTALDGAQALGVPDAAERRSRAVVAEAAGHSVAVLVDAASEVLPVAERDIRSPPRLRARGGDGDAGVAVGVVLSGERAIVLLDLARLVTSEKPGGSES